MFAVCIQVRNIENWDLAVATLNYWRVTAKTHTSKKKWWLLPRCNWKSYGISMSEVLYIAGPARWLRWFLSPTTAVYYIYSTTAHGVSKLICNWGPHIVRVVYNLPGLPAFAFYNIPLFKQPVAIAWPFLDIATTNWGSSTHRQNKWSNKRINLVWLFFVNPREQKRLTWDQYPSGMGTDKRKHQPTCFPHLGVCVCKWSARK